jgi:hypothetical protein
VVAACYRVAKVVGADVAVAAVAIGLWFALPLLAKTSKRADILVVTFEPILDGNIDAANLRVARVRGAGIRIVAVHRNSLALPLETLVVDRADVPVIAGDAVERDMDTATGRVAVISGTDIVVIADHRLAWLALTVLAHVAGRTGIPVVAGGRVRDVHATMSRVAGIGGTHIVVIAKVVERHMHAPDRGVALVHGARIPVVTGFHAGTLRPRIVRIALRAIIRCVYP